MGNIRDIKRRIESVTSTRQITNAMKMVAASKLRRAQERIVAARPYADYTQRMIEKIRKKNRQAIHPFFYPTNKDGKTAFVIVSADRGLCGSFNSEIIRKAENYLSENSNVDIICVGKKCYDQIKKNHKITSEFIGLFNEMRFTASQDISELLLDMYLNKTYSKVEILYNEFASVIQQNVVVKTILPIKPSPLESVSLVDFLYEPDEEQIIAELGQKYLAVEIWRMLLESSAAEQAARMTAMDNATENANELIEHLSLQYNRERQASITKEILEIVAGSEAINN